jgi:hypothetical protein
MLPSPPPQDESSSASAQAKEVHHILIMNGLSELPNRRPF